MTRLRADTRLTRSQRCGNPRAESETLQCFARIAFGNIHDAQLALAPVDIAIVLDAGTDVRHSGECGLVRTASRGAVVSGQNADIVGVDFCEKADHPSIAAALISTWRSLSWTSVNPSKAFGRFGDRIVLVP